MSDNTLISVTDLKKYYNGEAIKALDGVSAEIREGEVVVVIGPSGSGKSTFLRCLNLLEIPTSGHILFNGVDITDEKTDINLHRQKMGMPWAEPKQAESWWPIWCTSQSPLFPQPVRPQSASVEAHIRLLRAV